MVWFDILAFCYSRPHGATSRNAYLASGLQRQYLEYHFLVVTVVVMLGKSNIADGRMVGNRRKNIAEQNHVVENKHTNALFIGFLTRI